MKRLFTLLILVSLFGNNVFSQNFNHGLSKEELINVNGIGNKTYAKLENYITTGG